VTKAPKNVVASVLARLRNVAQEAGLSFNDILQSYVIERFLSRLSRSPHADTVLLKGALMLRVWGVPRARPTMDIDLLRRGVADQAALVRFVEQCATISDPSDGVIFDPRTISVEPIRDIWILSRTLAFSGPALSQAIRSTFDRRQTSVPAIPLAALTAKFYSEPVHVRQWAAFVRRIGEPALANEFSRVLADLAEFLMPAAKAAASSSAEYPVRWEPLGPWQHG
jgi:Nucleotidyl transferase AbiEii toxin, Type IV TA system